MADRATAAERLRGIEGPTFHGVGGKRHISEREYVDAVTLAMDWLAEHPADDGLIVTPDWLGDAGFTVGHYPSHMLADLPIDEQTGWYLFLRIRLPVMEAQICQATPGGESEGIALAKAQVQTRGDVRRLCAALGAPLKEQP